jgi:hypothetical protein
MTSLYLTTGDGLLVATRDGGEWRAVLRLEGHEVQSVAADPLRPELVYCGTFGDGLFRSEDAGATWRRSGAGISHGKVMSLAVSPVERTNGRGVVYAGTEPSAVFRSEDGGGRWHELTGLTDLPSATEWSFPPRPKTHHVRLIQPDPHAPGRLYVAIEAGALVRTDDAGRTWRDRVPGGPYDTHTFATHPAAPGRLYSAAGDGYFESRDGGDTWQQPNEGLHHGYAMYGALPSIRPTRKHSSSPLPQARARRTPIRPSRSSTAARPVGRGAKCGKGCPRRGAGTSPWSRPTPPSRACSTSPGRWSCAARPTPGRHGNHWKSHGRGAGRRRAAAGGSLSRRPGDVPERRLVVKSTCSDHPRQTAGPAEAEPDRLVAGARVRNKARRRSCLRLALFASYHALNGGPKL